VAENPNAASRPLCVTNLPVCPTCGACIYRISEWRLCQSRGHFKRKGVTRGK